MASRVCTSPGCPTLIPAGRSRCDPCERARDAARGRSHQRGYGRGHRPLRAAYQRRMDAGERFTCWRCDAEVDPEAWATGHCDDDRGEYHGPECPSCNYSTAGRRPGECPHPDHR